MTMPDLQQVAEYIARGQLEEPIYHSPMGPIAALDVCFGHRASIAEGNYFMAHKTGFSLQTLGQKLAACGFERIQLTRGKLLDLWAAAHKPG